MVVVDGEADAESVVRRGRELDAVFAPAHRFGHLEVALGALLIFQAGVAQQARDRRRAAVRRLGSLHRRSLDLEIVDAETRDRSQDVLHGVNLHVALLEDRAASRPGVEMGVLGPDLDFRPARQVAAHESHSGVRPRRAKDHDTALPGVEAHALEGDVPADRTLRLGDHRTRSSSSWSSSLPTRSSRAFVRRVSSGSRWRNAWMRFHRLCGMAG